MTNSAEPKINVKPKVSKKDRVLAALENAKKLLEQRKAQLEAIEAREHARANKTPASIINKQKFLLGAFVMETRPQIAKSADFQAWLKRDQDRAVFGLGQVDKVDSANG